MDIQTFNMKKLSGIVDKHNILINFVKQFNSTFRGSLLLMFILYPLLFFASISIFIATNNTLDRLVTGLIFVPTVATIYIFCCFCQDVKDEDEEIYMAIYSTNWQECRNIQVRKALLIILMQKPCYIKAGIESSFQMKTFLRGCLLQAAFI
ncbi:odorant receptor 22b-like [Chironomus tepperi]|uniref:odorant receptor 22b-like n=1 Tax=Chironomus tepperi TaxID=113505 RepID=UPI00391F9016